MTRPVNIDEILEMAAEISKLPGRSSVTANILLAYRELTNASFEEALAWWNMQVTR